MVPVGGRGISRRTLQRPIGADDPSMNASRLCTQPLKMRLRRSRVASGESRLASAVCSDSKGRMPHGETSSVQASSIGSEFRKPLLEGGV